MLESTLDTISNFIGISNAIIPNIITIIVVVIMIYLTLTGQLSWLTLISVYALSMGILTVLGINSVFNIITLIEVYVL